MYTQIFSFWEFTYAVYLLYLWTKTRCRITRACTWWWQCLTYNCSIFQAMACTVNIWYMFNVKPVGCTESWYEASITPRGVLSKKSFACINKWGYVSVIHVIGAVITPGSLVGGTPFVICLVVKVAFRLPPPPSLLHVKACQARFTPHCVAKKW